MLENMGAMLYNSGLKALEERNLTGALELFRQSKVFQPENTDCLNAIGLCCFELGDYDISHACWTKSIKLIPDGNPAGYYIRSLHESDFKAFADTYNEIINSINRHEYLTALFQLKRLKKRHVPLNLLNIEGLLLYRFGFKKQALKTWKKVLERDSSNCCAVEYITNAV